MTADRDTLIRLVARHDDERGACPPVADLVDAASGAAPADLRERIADHLVTCEPCSEEFRLVGETRDWASAHAHLLGDGSAAPPSRPARLPAWPWAMAAAALLAVSSALAWQVVQLRRENRSVVERASLVPVEFEARLAEDRRTIAELQARVRESEIPDLNTPIVDLEPADRPRGQARPADRALSASTAHVVLVLTTSRRGAGTYDVEIVAPGGGVLWTGSGLRESRDGTLTLTVPRALAVPGARIRLRQPPAAGGTLVEQYVLPAAGR